MSGLSNNLSNNAEARKSNNSFTLFYIYIIFFICFCLIFLSVYNSNWLIAENLHFILEAIASFTALLGGISCLIFFFGLNNRYYLIVGVGFFTVGSEGIIKTLNTFQPLANNNIFENTISDMFAVGNSILAIMIIIAPLFEKLLRAVKNKGYEALIATTIALGSGIVLPDLLKTINLPKMFFMGGGIPMPSHLISALLYCIALFVTIKRLNEKKDLFSGLLNIFIVLSIGHHVFMAFSKQDNDAFFSVSHIINTVSYIIPTIAALLQALVEIRKANHELSERLKIEKELEIQRDMAVKYFNAAAVMMDVMDSNLNIIHINKKGCEILGCTEEYILGRNWVDSFPCESIRAELRSYLTGIFNGEADTQSFAEYQIVTCKGEHKTMEWQRTLLTDENGRCIAILSSGQDITQRKEIDRMKSELINTVSHEIRTPLASILGFTELMLNRDLDTARIKKYLTTIYTESSRLSQLINDFLDIQRMESGRQAFERIVFDMGDLIEDTLQIYAEHKEHKFIIIKKNKQFNVNADYSKMKQLLTNIISNAVKYSPDGGDIIIEIQENKNEIQVMVEDHGIGIPESAIPNLFNKFYRVDNSDHRSIGGTGLGLAICKEIINAHDGRIWVESRQYAGSRFYFALPEHVVDSITQNADNSNIADITFCTGEEYILIVEDDVSLAQLIAENLSYNNWKYIIVKSGEEALEQIEKAHPMIIILDILLQGRMDGWGVLEVLKQKGLIGEIDVIISSSLEEPAKNEKYDKGYNAYFVKPYQLERLNSYINSLTVKHKCEKQEIKVVIKAESEEEESIIRKLNSKGFDINSKEVI